VFKKTAFILMKKYSLFSGLFRRFSGLVLLNISGLALGLASVIYIAIWINHELSYDKFFPNAERIFRVESLFDYSGEKSVWSITPAPLAESVKNEFPEVEDAVRLASGRQDVIKYRENLFIAENLYYTAHSFFSIFHPEVISGDTSQMLRGPDEVVLSRHAASVLFGNGDPVGKSILFNNTDLLTVKGVIEDFPSNTHLKVDYLVSFSILEKKGEELDSWGRFDFLTYILLKKNSDAEQFNNKISGYLKTKITNLSVVLFINPLTRIYLYRDPGFKSFKYPSSDRGPIARVILFAVIGFVLLLIACINFINLATAFASQRAKEIGIRKVNGAGRANLVVHFFGESLFQTFLATVAALIIVVALLPVFIKVSGVSLGIADLFTTKKLAIYLILTLTTGIIAGMYPALLLSSFNPAKVIKPLPEDTFQGSGLRKVLVVIQFMLSIVFIFCILIMNRQVSFMQTINLGFNKEGVMVVSPHVTPEKTDVIAEQIEKIPGVKKVALGGNVPVNMGNFNTLNKWDGNVSGKPLMFYMMQVDDRYLDLLGIRLAEGKNFNTTSFGTEVIVNETAVKKMEMDDPVGKSIWLGNTRYTIIGVVRDFHFHRLKEEIRPVFIYKNKDWWIKRIFVSLEPGNHFQVVDKITETVRKSNPGFPVRYMFLDQEINRYYDEERRLNLLINAATVLSIVISCIGLFSLTAFTLRKRSREIGIRKAYGATAVSILVMLQKDFGRLVLAASMIALPAGYFIIKQWLSSYAYHVGINAFYLFVTLIIITMIAALTLIFHTLRAANLNPADTLRNE
jgi:putative ABC transport system permease protein